MFTGIVEQLGTVRSAEPSGHGAVIVVDPGDWAYRPDPGDSVAVNGCCLTATGPGPDLRFDVIGQTLSTTTLGDLLAGDRVNLEHAVTPSTMLGGHVVQGHIDGVAVIRSVSRQTDDWRLRLEPPPALTRYIIEKGSVALDGVSLTVAAIDETGFEVALIPTTLSLTTFGEATEGGRCNIEVDYVAKVVVHAMQWHMPSS